MSQHSAESVSQDYPRKRPATLADLQSVLDQAHLLGAPAESEVRALVNFRGGITRLTVIPPATAVGGASATPQEDTPRGY